MEQKSNIDYEEQAIRELIKEVEDKIISFTVDLDRIEITYKKACHLHNFLVSPQYENRLNMEMFGFETKKDYASTYGFDTVDLKRKIQALTELKVSLENYKKNNI